MVLRNQIFLYKWSFFFRRVFLTWIKDTFIQNLLADVFLTVVQHTNLENRFINHVHVLAKRMTEIKKIIASNFTPVNLLQACVVYVFS